MLFVDDTVSVPVRYRVKGYKDGQVEVTLRLNGQEVAKKVVDVKEGDDLREVLSFGDIVLSVGVADVLFHLLRRPPQHRELDDPDR